MDIDFIKENKRFRLRACAVIYRDGKILMAKNEEDDYYYSVGGGVKHGETVEEAVIREVYEETGSRLEIDRLLFIHQNFFNHQFPFHELAFYFLMKDNKKNLISKGITSTFIREETIWLSKEDFDKNKVYPSNLFDLLECNDIKILSTRESS